VGKLKKQSQFAAGLNWRKLFSERKLWQYTGLRAQKKQSQFKLVPSASSGQALSAVEWSQLRGQGFINQKERPKNWD